MDRIVVSVLLVFAYALTTILIAFVCVIVANFFISLVRRGARGPGLKRPSIGRRSFWLTMAVGAGLAVWLVFFAMISSVPPLDGVPISVLPFLPFATVLGAATGIALASMHLFGMTQVRER